MKALPAIGLGFLAVAFLVALSEQPKPGSTAASSSAGSAAGSAAIPDPRPCAAVHSQASRDGRTVVEYPVSQANSPACTLGSTDDGATVAALQRALALCMKQPVTPDGVYGAATLRAVEALGGTDGAYGPGVAGRMRWPSFAAGTHSFTGRCSAATSS